MTFLQMSRLLLRSVLILVLANCEGYKITLGQELQTITSIPINELIRNLQSLAVAPRTRLLRKDPMSKDVKPTDRFFYNDAFTSKYTRLKVGVVANRAETDKERKETVEKVDETRSHQVEAAIVRIMKYVLPSSLFLAGKCLIRYCAMQTTKASRAYGSCK